MTAQEIFDKIVSHLRAQGVKSIEFGGGPDLLQPGEVRCLYRGPLGTKCAVGCLISDEVYDEDMEDFNILEVIATTPMLKHLMPHHQFLVALQTIHDSDDVVDWERRFQWLAVKHGLVYPPLQK